MGYLNEPIARRANKEDGVKGRFFEERFRAELILDDAGLLARGMYVDLNPIRACVAQTPEECRFTSASDRILDRRLGEAIEPVLAESFADRPHGGWMTPIASRGDGYDGIAAGRRIANRGMFDFDLDDYLRLLDWTGRQLRSDKRGAIPAHLAPILERPRIHGEAWVELVGTLGRRFRRFIGGPERLAQAAKERGQHWVAGIRTARSVFT